MELNVFTQQLEQCYNILSQQFVIIKQLKDLTLGTQNESSAINELNQRLNGLENTFEDLVRVTPTDVRVVKDQDKWQLQLEHDNNVLSIDEGLQIALDSVKLFKHNLRLTIIEESETKPPFTNDLIVYSKSSEPLTLNNIIDLIVCKKETSQIYDTNNDEEYCILGLDNIIDSVRIIAYTTYDNTVVIYKILAIQSDIVE